MTDFDLVVTGRVVLPDSVLENGYVAVRGGLVERVGSGAPPQAAERHDFGSAFVMPGAIDAQVHSRSQKDQEDFIWSTRAAAAGGVTTIVDMPYDDGVLICTPERLATKAKRRPNRPASILRFMRRSIRDRALRRSRLWQRPAPPVSNSPPSKPILTAFRASRRRCCMIVSKRSRAKA